mgnify:CR=1 FL=1
MWSPKEWRPEDWIDKKQKILQLLSIELGNHLEEFADGILIGYRHSPQFEEDAETYCREQGWQEPS